ncbi:acylphosphatase [Microbacterium sp. CSI-V]|uniref:acylphosphatase n=1 Tax=unclassified Microbacterium TaxID=2609290 RepID=UPI00097BACFF|nr:MULTISPECIES: acylphosphatase [unclassified Microbacterium]MXS74291.1 acylphosphatase [Microbacterium sp. TL13]ONI62914.1 acylphosphatase [Microbacterium sp. CSI-V]
MAAVEITVRGHVQGVGFRWALRAEAERVGATGWVRNRRDGAVEAYVAGTATAVESLVAWAQHGPPLARVERVEVTEVSDAADGSGFEIRDSV